MSNAEVNEQLMTEQLLKLMEGLKPTPELCNDAADTFSAKHHDDTDIALVNAFKKVINTSGGLGPDPGTLWDWAEATFGVAVGNAVGFASNISRLLEGEGMKERKAKLIGKLVEAAFAYAPENVKTMIEPAMEQLGSSKAILFLWAMYNEGIRQGMIMGWRAHELALLASTEASQDEVEK